jgi:hypothetical protein
MNESEPDLVWHPLPHGSRRRLRPSWPTILAPLEGLFHAGQAPAVECTPQRLSALRNRATEALAAVGPVFKQEAERLRWERYGVLGTAGVLSLACIVLGCLITTNGYELIKAFLTAGGTGGLMTWGVTLAFRRVDQERQLRLFPSVFAIEFNLCKDCDAYERVFERFGRAAESLRGPS